MFIYSVISENEIKVLNCIFPSKYVIPKKFKGWPLAETVFCCIFLFVCFVFVLGNNKTWTEKLDKDSNISA